MEPKRQERKWKNGQEQEYLESAFPVALGRFLGICGSLGHLSAVAGGRRVARCLTLASGAFGHLLKRALWRLVCKRSDVQRHEAIDDQFPSGSYGSDSGPTRSVEEAFSALVEHVVKLDPIKLLCNLSLTHLSQDTNAFLDEAHEVDQWVVRIEIVAGILLARPYPSNPKPEVTSADIGRLHQLIEIYESSLFKAQHDEKSSDPVSARQHIIGSVRNYAFWVRGTAYIHQYSAISRAIYSPHQDWFKTNLGFTVDEAMLLVESCIKECETRINREFIAAHDHVESLAKGAESSENTSDQSGFSVFYQHYFGRADEIIGFSVCDFSRVSGLSRITCENILARLSQEFGYHNPKYPNVFTDAKSAPWDYNTLYERPFVRHGQRYWMVLPAIVHPVLMNTFYYDLMNDRGYRSKFERSRGKWLENETAKCLKRVFPSDQVLLNPCYTNGNEMADVLVLHDRKALVIQCKSKRLTFEASKGRNFEELKGSLEKAVKDAFKQGDRARQCLLQNSRVTLQFNNSNLWCDIDSKQIDRVYIVVVTATPLQFLATRWASINAELQLFPTDDYPWCLSISDLEVICEIFPDAVRFLHYVRRRLCIELGKPEVIGDELDLLGMYLNQCLYFEGDEYKNLDLVGLAEMSKDIDEYMFRKHVLGEPVQRPAVAEPERFSEFVAALARCSAPYSSNVALAILDLDSKLRKEFMDLSVQIMDRTKADGNLHNFSVRIAGTSKVISFVSMDAAGSHEVVSRHLFDRACEKAQQGHCTEFFGIGWDSSTEEIVDTTFYALFGRADQDV